MQLRRRYGVEAPVLILSDGHTGLRKEIALWPEAQVQRCTWHRSQNLVEHCPVHAAASSSVTSLHYSSSVNVSIRPYVNV